MATEQNTYLSKDDILKAEDLPVEEVEVPEWGGVVRVRGLSALERDRYELQMHNFRKDTSKANVRAPMVVRCAVDADGKRLFTDSDAEPLAKKSGAALDRVWDKVRELSGMDTDDDDGRSVEDRAEDFGNAPSDGSPSD